MFRNVICDIVKSSTEERPLILLDSRFDCVFSGNKNIIKPGMSLMPLLRARIVLPLESICEDEIYHKGRFYCVRLIPVRTPEKERAYICELVDTKSVVRMSEKTDLGAEQLLEYGNMQHKLAGMWQCLTSLRNDKGADATEHLDRMEELLYSFSDIIANKHELLSAIYNEKNHTLFDVHRLCDRLSVRCNAVLAKCGRSIEYIGSDGGPLYVHLSSRLAVVALVNAIQNALLYSPKDTVPTIIAFAENGYVVVRTENESIMHTEQDFANGKDIEFNDQRTDSGMSVIRTFVESAGGTMTCENNDGTFTLELRLPAAAGDDPECFFESEISMAVYSCVPDFVQIKMNRVAELYGEGEMTENVQDAVTHSS